MLAIFPNCFKQIRQTKGKTEHSGHSRVAMAGITSHGKKVTGEPQEFHLLCEEQTKATNSFVAQKPSISFIHINQALAI